MKEKKKVKKKENKREKNNGNKVFPILFLILFIIIFAFIFKFGSGFGFGKGNGDIGNTQHEVSKIKKNQDKGEVKEEQRSSNTESHTLMLKVSVINNEYFYDNNRISLDDFINKVKETETDKIVEVKDDNASLKAYNALLDKLKELKVSFIER